MLRPKTRWRMLPANDDEISRLAEACGISPLVARLCWQRGVRTPVEVEQFLHIETASFHDPFLLKGMKEAYERIRIAIDRSEHMLIYGDYDADGVSSTAIMIYLLTHLDAHFEYYIPDRFSEGYGLNEEVIERAKEKGITLIITVDTGISAIKEVERAKELGIDVIVTDHHEPPEEIPDAYAVINPKQKDCTYPYPYLSGAGVALKLAQALLDEVPNEWIGISAIGTIADLVPLTGENRLIAYKGLKALSHSRQPGIKALLRECGIEEGPLEAFHIGYAIGPRINAGGRLERADIGVKLLTTDDEEEARTLAKRLDQLNAKRQELVQEIAEIAIDQAEQFMASGLSHVLVVSGEDWNEGVIGIVAARLVERFYRPAIVCSIDRETGTAKASARSIEGFDLYENLSHCKDLLLKFGGHTMAAGLSIDAKEIDALRIRLNQQAMQTLSPEDLVPISNIDLECSLKDLSIPLLDEIGRLAPFGIGNPEPLVRINDLSISSLRRVGKDGSHLKCVFQQDDVTLDGIAFQKGEIIELVSSHANVSIIGELGINEWNGMRKPQIFVKDLSIPHLQLFDKRGTERRWEAIHSIPDLDQTVLLYFRPNHRNELEEMKGLLYAIAPVLRNGEVIGDERILTAKQLILYDLPESFDSLYALSVFPDVERIWCLFGQELNERRLARIPSREEFKWLYGYLFKHKTITPGPELDELGRRRGINRDEMAFMLRVFLDLHFIFEEHGVLHLNEQPKKRDFSESPTYQRQKERLEIETELVFSSVHSLFALFEQYRFKHDHKEAIVS